MLFCGKSQDQVKKLLLVLAFTFVTSIDLCEQIMDTEIKSQSADEEIDVLTQRNVDRLNQYVIGQTEAKKHCSRCI